MNYLPLFHLQVQHAYYGDRPCRDLGIVPSSETQRLLAGHRLLLREQGSGITVLAEAADDGQSTLISINDDTRLTFELQIRNSDYSLITDLFPFAGKSHPVFTNFVSDDADESLTLQLIDLASSESTIVSSTYRSNILAHIELRLNSAMNDLSTGPRSYTISLRAKQAYWAYYLISNQAGAFSLLDTASSGALRFSSTDLTTSTIEDPIAQTLSTQYLDSPHRILFLSDDLVACSMSPRTGIRFRLNDVNVSNAAMPNPSIQRTGRRGGQDILYQVVTHLTQN